MKCSWPTCNESAVKNDYCFQHNRIYGRPDAKSEKKPIAKVSDKEKDRLKEYRKVRKAYLITHPKCEVKGCQKVAMEVHHKKGRIGDLLIDTSTFMAVCDEHHRLIEDNPQWAKEQGYSSSRLKPNLCG